MSVQRLEQNQERPPDAEIKISIVNDNEAIENKGIKILVWFRDTDSENISKNLDTLINTIIDKIVDLTKEDKITKVRVVKEEEESKKRKK